MACVNVCMRSPQVLHLPCCHHAAEAPAPQKKPAFAFGGFGTRKITRAQPAAVEEEEEEEEEAPPATQKKRGGFFTIGSKKAAPAAAEEEVEEEEEAAPAKRGAFAFAGSRRPAAAVAEAEAPATRRIVRGRAPVAAAVEEKPAPRAAPKQPEPAGEKQQKKSGGFLGFLGVSNETIYAVRGRAGAGTLGCGGCLPCREQHRCAADCAPLQGRVCPLRLPLNTLPLRCSPACLCRTSREVP